METPYLIFGPENHSTSYHSQFIQGNMCYYGYVLNDTDIAERYIKQFQNSETMRYAKVPMELICRLRKTIGLELVYNNCCGYDETNSVEIVASDDELSALYEIMCGRYTSDLADRVILDMVEVTKSYKCRTSKKLARLLREFLKEIHNESEDMIHRTKKYYIMEMKAGGLR